MNERIQKLIAQATKVVEPNDPDYRHEIFDKQKFAELIIEECAEIFEGLYTDQQRPERIDTRIKRHFGVG